MSKKSTALKVTTFVTSMLMGFGLIASEMTTTWEIAINRYLPGQTSSGVNNSKYHSDYASAKELVEAKRELISDIVSEGSTLLKNNNKALPLAKGAKVSLFGRSSVRPVFGSVSGGGKVTSDYNFKDVLKSDGIEVNETLWSYYQGVKGNNRGVNGGKLTIGEVDPEKYSSEVKNSYKNYSDAAIVIISRAFGEGSDAPISPSGVKDGDGLHNAIELHDVERKVIAEAKKCSSKVIVVINSDFAMGIDELKNDAEIDSILWTGALGNSGIYGLCDILSGEVCPSGHLPDTIAASVYSAPAVQNYGNFTYTNAEDITAASANNYVVYQEGIYVGYRYYETRYEDLVLGLGNASSNKGAFMDKTEWDYSKEVSYPFGYGLSYTSFEREITNLKWDEANKKVTMAVKTKNTGDVAGKDVIQVYVNSPYTQYDKDNNVEKASVALVGFEKTDILKPVEEAEVTLELDMNLIASYDYKEAKTFILDYGDYYFGIGDGSHDALNNILAAKNMTVSDGMDYNGNAKEAVKYTKTNSTGSEVDKETCSKSQYTGTDITNRLDNADLNYYGDMVTYLSRKDWAGTWNDGISLTATEQMKEDLKAGSSYERSPESNDLSSVVKGKDYENSTTSIALSEMNGLPYDDPKWNDLLNQLSLDEMSRLVGLANSGVIESITMPNYTAFDGPNGICGAYLTDDQEYAIYASMYESEPLLAATFNKELAKAQGEMFGNDGLWTGFHCVWGPGNNTHRTAYLGRNTEYYSEDGVLAYYITKEEVNGAAKYGLSMGPKHFAFNDQEINRGGVSTFVNEQAAREIYLRAFEGALAAGEAKCTMIAKNRLGCKYIGALSGLMKDILVDEWGYRGVVIADSASDGYVNGPTSIINGTTEFDTNSKDFITGSLSPKELGSDSVLFHAVKEACHRNLYLWANTWLVTGYDVAEKAKASLEWYQLASICVASIAGGLFVCSVALSLVNKLKKTKTKEEK